MFQAYGQVQHQIQEKYIHLTILVRFQQNVSLTLGKMNTRLNVKKLLLNFCQIQEQQERLKPLGLTVVITTQLNIGCNNQTVLTSNQISIVSHSFLTLVHLLLRKSLVILTALTKIL